MDKVCLIIAVLFTVSLARRCPLLRAPDLAVKTGCYIIVIRNDISSERFEQIVRRATSLAEENKVYGCVQSVTKAVTLKLCAYSLALLREVPEIKYIEEETMARGAQSPVPYHLDRLDQRHLPLDGRYNPTGDGEGVDIYVLDTGVYYEHQEFGNRAKFGGYDSVDEHLGENRTGRDCNGHGTHVASNAAGERYGTANNATIYSIRVLRCEATLLTPWRIILAGLDYVMRVIPSRGRPAVVSMSLYGAYTQSVNDAVQAIYRSGIPVVVCAGNDAEDACSQSPASAPDVITVAGSANGDTLYTYTNYGPCVDIFAPGASIQGADLQCDSCSSFWTGTSFATSLVSGAIATLLQMRPELTPNEIINELISSSVKNSLNFVTIPVNFRVSTPNQALFIPVQCPRLQEPSHGDVKIDLFGFTKVGIFTCEVGFGLVGTPVIFCQENGTWSDGPPVCKRICEVSPTPEILNFPSPLSSLSTDCPPTLTYPSPTPCPTTECRSCPSTTASPHSITSSPPTTTVTPPPISPPVPGNVENVVSPSCGRLEWDTPGGGVGLTYKIRFYSGQSFSSTPPSQRVVLSSPTNSLTFTGHDVPTQRPLHAIVKARNRNGVHSPDWSAPITAAVVGCL